jgi:hypothetical protein
MALFHSSASAEELDLMDFPVLPSNQKRKHEINIRFENDGGKNLFSGFFPEDYSEGNLVTFEVGGEYRQVLSLIFLPWFGIQEPAFRPS